MAETYDPEALRDAPGALPLRAHNIAPHRGDRLVGYVPYGLTAVEADNMRGKSRLLAAVTALQLPTLRPGSLTTTEGETEAAISLGAAELRVVERASGTKKTTRRDVDAEGPIRELPDPVETLITGGNFKDEDARWRARLKALLDFYEVEVTPARVAALAGEDAELPSSTFRSLLDAADYFGGPRGIYNTAALAAERAAALAEGEKLKAQGAADSIRAEAEKMLPAGGDPEARAAKLDELLAASATAVEIARMEHQDAVAEAARLREGARGRREAEERREKLRAAHGPRPEPRLDGPALAWRDVEAAITALRLVVFPSTKGGVDREWIADPSADLAEAEGEVRSALLRLRGSLAVLQRENAAVTAWEALAAEIAAPVEWPTDDDVAAAERRADELAARAELLRHAAAYRARVEAVARHREEERQQRDRGKAMREEARATWDRLGEVLNDAIRSTLVRVHAGRIEVQHDDGRWLDVADDVRLSSGRLRRAFLDFFLDRCEPDLNVVVGEEVMLPIGPDGRREISARAAAKRCRLLFEDPAEWEEPRLRWYGAAAAEAR